MSETKRGETMKSIGVGPDGHVINRRQRLPGAIGCGILLCLLLSMQSVLSEAIPDDLNRQLREILAQNQFTGRVESTLEQRLGRRIDPAKAELGPPSVFRQVRRFAWR